MHTHEDGRLDLVPMIDCIMLLLIFFVMTTKFQAPELAIGALLPTENGQTKTPAKVADPKPIIAIGIAPAGLGFVPGRAASEYQAALAKLTDGGVHPLIQSATLRIGQREPITLDAARLKGAGSPEVDQYIASIHQHIAADLAAYEVTGQPRNLQPDIAIHSFSGLPWAFALIAYDAVRAYEGARSGRTSTGDPADLDQARAVAFAPPSIRDHDRNELGDELQRIIQLH